MTTKRTKIHISEQANKQAGADKDNKDFTLKISVGRCPNCGGQTAVKYRPFCSVRCANVDLYNWLNGRYAISDNHDEHD